MGFEGEVYGPCSNDWPGNVHVSRPAIYPPTRSQLIGLSIMLCSSLQGKVYGPCSNDWPGNVHVSRPAIYPPTRSQLIGLLIMLCSSFDWNGREKSVAM